MKTSTTKLIILFIIIFITPSVTKSQTNQKNNTVIKNTETTINNIENFDVFYKKFHKDTIFQLNRIKFPIDGAYSDFDTVMKWTTNNWEYLKFTIDQVDKKEYNIVFKKNKSEVIEEVNCKDCGFSFKIKFELFDSKWYLTYRQDNNF